MLKRYASGIAALALITLASSQVYADSAVTVTEDTKSYTLDNGIVTAKVLKATGDLVSMRYKGLEMLGAGSGHPYGYWSHEPGAGTRVADNITINPATNGGTRGEVSVKGFFDGAKLGAGPGGGTAADIEIRYTLGSGDSGLYTYTIFDHKVGFPATGIGEARFGAKLNAQIFDYMAVDANRHKIMITADDWNKGTRLNMKEVRRITTGQYAGQAEHKYDYSAVQFETPAFGWASTPNKAGFWFVNPTNEYLSGGPTKVELTTHRDVNEGADPVMLNYWRGSHYGGTQCDMGADEVWTRVVGPFLIYCNSGATGDAMWHDALAQADKEAKAWPYPWVSGVDYPKKAERATVSGQVVLSDPQAASSQLTNLLVGLAHPDYVDGTRTVDWQRDAKYYQFWVHADAQGHFTIPNVRPGTYTLHAIANNVLGEYAKTDVTIVAGKPIDFGKLTWVPVRYGRQLWDIGIPDRTASEFLHGDHYWQWGLYNLYPKDFPNDVNYVIGKSDYHKDWNYVQVPRATDDSGNSLGPATTWSVTFNLPKAQSGKATLRLALASSSAKHIDIDVNDQAVGTAGPLEDTATIRRDGIRGFWRECDIVFDASMLKSGTNVLKLTVPAAGVMYGVEYDYLRLEVDDTKTAQNN